MSFSRKSCFSLGAFVEVTIEVSLEEGGAVVLGVVVGGPLSCCRAFMRSRNDTLRPPAVLAAIESVVALTEGAAGGADVVGVVSVIVIVVVGAGGVHVT